MPVKPPSRYPPLGKHHNLIRLLFQSQPLYTKQYRYVKRSMYKLQELQNTLGSSHRKVHHVTQKIHNINTWRVDQPLLGGNGDRDARCASPPPEGNNGDKTKGGAEDNDLDSGGLVLASVVDVEAGIAEHGVHLLRSKLVVSKTNESDTVTEVLLAADRVTEDRHRGHNQENVLQNTGHGKNNGRGLANLFRSISRCISANIVLS